MTILPGLTSTQKDRIPAFVDDLRRSPVRAIALFPTVLTADERSHLYRDLESIDGLVIPHVHLRTDFDEAEMAYLVDRFATEAFNLHPQASRHPFGPVPERFRDRVFIENVELPPEDAELERLAGLCPDYSHLESARWAGNDGYVKTVERQFRTFPIGCCHIAGVREGDPNVWNGGPDHHNVRSHADLDYMRDYVAFLPTRWVSLELENPLDEQLDAARYLAALTAERRKETTGTRRSAG